MTPSDVLGRLEDLTFLDPLVNRARTVVRALLTNRQVKDVLHGTWLGHPLHPALAQATLGSWTSASLLDLTGRRRYEPAADLLAAVGTAVYVPTIAAGWADWADLHDPEARAGLVHATANIAAAGLVVGSLVAGAQGRRGRVRVLRTAALAASGFGGILGGHLAYRRGAGVNRNADLRDLGPTDWADAGPSSEVAEGTLVRRMVGDAAVLLVRRGGTVLALSDVCSHLAAPLSDGEVTEQNGEPCIVCPWHGSVFSLRDGRVLAGPATAPQPVFETRVQGGTLQVRAVRNL